MNFARTGARAALAATAGALLLLFAAPVAGAQTVTNPYGSTTTSVPGGSADTGCSLNVSKGKPGDLVQGTVFPVEPGAVVRILFDGEQVGIGTAPSIALPQTGGNRRPVARTGAASLDFGVQAQAAGAPVRFDQARPVTSVTISWRVPDVTPGAHSVTAVGANFTCFCNPDGVFTVEAKDAGRTGNLARTGIYVALFVVAAAFCFVLGRAFLRASHIARARAEAAAREAERPRISLDS
jgi:hypothetical protein